jgi:general transcription factor 3C polypeptide 3 (transcription factor C subunit 4)
VLPVEIQGLMGEANLSFARGETNKAIDICTEVIKHAPKASEPFQLLSLLYSEIGDNDKALRVGLIAAQLNKDPDEWIQLIHQSIMLGNDEILLFCYNNGSAFICFVLLTQINIRKFLAIQSNPNNINLHKDRISFLESKKDFKRLIIAKLMLLKYLDVSKNLDDYNKYFNETYQVLERLILNYNSLISI